MICALTNGSYCSHLRTATIPFIAWSSVLWAAISLPLSTPEPGDTQSHIIRSAEAPRLWGCRCCIIRRRTCEIAKCVSLFANKTFWISYPDTSCNMSSKTTQSEQIKYGICAAALSGSAVGGYLLWKWARSKNEQKQKDGISRTFCQITSWLQRLAIH